MRRALIVAALVVAGTSLALLARSAHRAREQRDAARKSLASLRQVAAEVRSLRARPPSVALEERPEQGLVGRLSSALASAGLPSSLMTTFSPGSDAPFLPDAAMTAEDGTRENAPGLYRRQEVRFTLEPVSLPELGRFLARWRVDHPEWSCAVVEVTPLNAAGVDAARTGEGRGGEVRLRAAIGLEAVYLARGGS